MRQGKPDEALQSFRKRFEPIRTCRRLTTMPGWLCCSGEIWSKLLTTFATCFDSGQTRSKSWVTWRGYCDYFTRGLVDAHGSRSPG